MKEYYAHSLPNESNKSKWQTLTEHSLNVANKSYSFAKRANMPESICNAVYNTCLYHDLGKAQDDFTKKLEGKNIKVIHSSGGAKAALEEPELKKHGICLIYAFVISSHHGQTRNKGSKLDKEDSGTLAGFLKNVPTYDKDFFNSLTPYLKKIDMNEITIFLGNRPFSIFIFIQMLRSFLIDADYLDTEEFINKKYHIPNYDWKSTDEELNILIKNLNSNKYLDKINEYRCDILNSLIKKASYLPKGFYSVSSPPGSGKTISCLSFAIKHLIKNNLEKIITIEPMITLTNQTAKNFKNIFGKENVLEHHSSFSILNENDLSEHQKEQLILASQNFDYPFVNTTFNQFFDAIFKGSTSSTRKLHNFANSVIIVDEPQNLPYHLLTPIMHVLCELVVNYNCSVILSTATPCNYSQIFNDNQQIKNLVETNNIEIIELVDNLEEVYKNFIRNTFEFINKKISLDELATIIDKTNSTLIVFNSRKKSQKFFKKLKTTNKFYLSNLMCKKHIEETIEKIKACNFQCILVATSIVDTGMDFDFENCYRENASLASILQSAGRKNRNNKFKLTPIYIFELDEFNHLHEDASITKQLFKEGIDFNSPEAINKFYTIKHNEKDPSTRDKYNLYQKIISQNYRDVHNEYHFIEDKNNVSILIKYDNEATKIINNINLTKDLNNKQLQQYTISIYENQFNDLKDFIEIKTTLDEVEYYILNNIKYSEECGLLLDEEISTSLTF